ncbi:Uncharacterised protein [Staphylococcus aureus]|nr:Uncharacterised protein [Staphylococcus aureus]
MQWYISIKVTSIMVYPDTIIVEEMIFLGLKYDTANIITGIAHKSPHTANLKNNTSLESRPKHVNIKNHKRYM